MSKLSHHVSHHYGCAVALVAATLLAVLARRSGRLFRIRIAWSKVGPRCQAADRWVRSAASQWTPMADTSGR